VDGNIQDCGNRHPGFGVYFHFGSFRHFCGDDGAAMGYSLARP